MSGWLYHKCCHRCVLNRSGRASVIKTYGTVYQGCFCSVHSKPGSSHLYLFRHRFWNLHGSAGSFYRSGEDQDYSCHQPAAGMASAIHIYPGNRTRAELLFCVLGKLIFQLYGCSHYYHSDFESKMGL